MKKQTYTDLRNQSNFLFFINRVNSIVEDMVLLLNSDPIFNNVPSDRTYFANGLKHKLFFMGLSENGVSRDEIPSIVDGVVKSIMYSSWYVFDKEDPKFRKLPYTLCENMIKIIPKFDIKELSPIVDIIEKRINESNV